MKDHYAAKVLLIRLIFLSIVTACYFLYRYNLIDYVIVISFIVLFLGLFSTSTVDLTAQEIKIRKNYFWALFELRRNLQFDQVISINAKDYVVETHEDAWIFTESIFSFVIIDFFKPKIHWAMTKLSYVDQGIEKNIELKITRNDYRDIEKEIRRHPIFSRRHLPQRDL